MQGTKISPLIYADSESNADQLYFSKVFVPDPFLSFGIGKKKYAIVNDLEYTRLKKEAVFDDVLSLGELQKIAEKSNGSVSAITFNQETANSLTQYNLSEILYIEDPKLENYNPLYYLSAMEQISKQESPDMIIFGHTYEARDWVPRLSARLDIPFICSLVVLQPRKSTSGTHNNIHLWVMGYCS